jgi:hypothetical protein
MFPSALHGSCEKHKQTAFGWGVLLPVMLFVIGSSGGFGLVSLNPVFTGHAGFRLRRSSRCLRRRSGISALPQLKNWHK